MKQIMISLFVACSLVLCIHARSQPSSPSSNFQDSALHSVNALPDRALRVLSDRYSILNRIVQSQTEKMMHRMQRKELALQQRLSGQVHGTDSIRMAALFAETQTRFQHYLTMLATPQNVGQVSMKEYLPGLDSMQTTLRFLGFGSMSGLTIEKVQRIQQLSAQLQQLQAKFQQTNDIQTFIRQRERQLKDQLSPYAVSKQLLGLNAEAYYYQVRLAQYKTVLNDPSRYQEVVLSAVRQLPAFEEYWRKNSYLSQLFPTSPQTGTPLALAGLQTSVQVQQHVKQQLGISATTNLAGKAGAVASGGGGAGYLQAQIQQAQTQVSALKAKLSQLGGGSGPFGGGNSNMTMPDFQPNSQCTKSFFQRLYYSLMIQNSPSTTLLPAISNLGLNIGYRLSDQATFGFGGGYLLGLGNGLNHIRFTNQGASLRSFLNVKAKGSIWITGGFEYNYFQQFTGIKDLENSAAWQKSALIGLTKTYKIGKKENNIQLLYDILAANETPRGQAIQFRIGWGL